MSERVAVIGDIHGNSAALAGMLDLVRGEFDIVVFAGDYVDRGPNSRAVIQALIEYAESDDTTIFLAGNHDTAFLNCIDSGAITEFLRMGGAATIKSYVGEPEPDLVAQLRRVVPLEHVRCLRLLREWYSAGGELVVTHDPRDRPASPHSAFHVSGHVPQRGLLPRITQSAAAIDTGCGTLATGRLTCFVWPARDVVQVDALGNIIR